MVRTIGKAKTRQVDINAMEHMGGLGYLQCVRRGLGACVVSPPSRWPCWCRSPGGPPRPRVVPPRPRKLPREPPLLDSPRFEEIAVRVSVTVLVDISVICEWMSWYSDDGGTKRPKVATLASAMTLYDNLNGFPFRHSSVGSFSLGLS